MVCFHSVWETVNCIVIVTTLLVFVSLFVFEFSNFLYFGLVQIEQLECQKNVPEPCNTEQ